MHRWATKDRYEREQEETERLVRRNPKDKPARHDLRRERVEPESDADDQDESDKKDRSKNYKTIGGSERFSADHRVPAKSRETGKVVYVSPETLKEDPGKYELVDQDDNSSEESQFYGQLGQSLRGLAKADPKLTSKLKDFSNPESHLYGFVRENPEYPAAKLFPGVELPEGIHTLGDVQKALQHSGKPPTAKKKAPKEAPVPQPQGEAPAQEEKPNPEGQKEEEPSKTEPEAEEGKKEDGGEEDPDEKPSVPSLPQVKRRPVTETEKLEAVSLVADSFPPEDAAKILSIEGLHPDDVKVLVRDYLSAKEGQRVGKLTSFVSKVAPFYDEGTEPSEVTPKKGENSLGEVLPFEELTDEEKAEATLKHRLGAIALSFAARSIVKDRLMDVRVISGKPRIPDDVASKIADSMFRKPSEDLGPTSFDAFLATGSETPIDEKTAKSLLDKVSGNESGSVVAKAFLQANDYALAKRKYLRGDDESISEWQTPEEIVKGLKKAGQFFDERNAWYGASEDHPAAGFFRMRVLQRLKALDPTKARAVTSSLPELELEEYREKLKLWRKAHDTWVHQEPKTGPEPVRPPHPVRAPDKATGRKLWKGMFSQKLDKKSSYLSGLVMSSSGKKAVYNGVDPYAYGPAEYQKWSQPRQRDIGAKEEKEILAAARERLASPLLTVSVNDMVPDAKLRAALDLAIYSGPYNGQIQPNLYNSLLARLAGVPEPEKGKNTLLTQRTAEEAKNSYDLSTQMLTVTGSGASEVAVRKVLETVKLSYKDLAGASHSDGFASLRSASTKDSEVSFVLEFPKGSGAELYRTLQAAFESQGLKLKTKSSETSPGEMIRVLASKVSDDSVAFEMLAYAQDLEGRKADDQYSNLKAAIVRYASRLPPSQREVLLPILKTLKALT